MSHGPVTRRRSALLRDGEAFNERASVQANGHADGMLRAGIHSRTTSKAELEEAGIPLLEAKATPFAVETPALSGLSAADRRAMLLLVALYLLQGIPMGLAFGSIPFLLRERLSYSQIGFFSLASYPYSLKLLWSPIVDAIYSPKFGRRKSWIMPIQVIMGLMLFWLGATVPKMLDQPVPDVHSLTFLFVTLVFLAATQDIAVDGWALTLLSKDNVGYASTAQTIGLNSGYFLSFTVFLALNSADFANKYFRSVPSDLPFVSLASYLKFWGIAFIAVTAYLLSVHTDDPDAEDSSELDVKNVYRQMLAIIRLKPIGSFVLVHLVNKLGVAAHDAATQLKLLEKGFSKEDLALCVLIDFPVQVGFGWLAATWSSGKDPLKPWLRSTWARHAFAALAMIVVYSFPAVKPTPKSFFGLVIGTIVFGGMASTIQFSCINAFHSRIADPLVGGTYMTLINTIANLGGTLPRYFVLKSIDLLTEATCQIPQEGSKLINAQECVSDHGKALCTAAGATCVVKHDGYYPVSSTLLIVGSLILLLFVTPTAKRLQRLPAQAWRISSSGRRE